MESRLGRWVGLFTVAIVAMFAVVASIGAAGGGVALAAVMTFTQGLPDPVLLEDLRFAQPTIVYDRTGTIELGRFQAQDRRVVPFEELPTLLLDATTNTEDRTFWENEGFDPAAILSAAADHLTGASSRGASTVTQQLVRARLLPDDLVAEGADAYRRKVAEIIQAARVTGAFPGEDGKQRIITAYLNQNFYGHDAYGIASAASTYFGVTDLSKLTAAQAALLVGLPKSPSTLDPYLYATRDKQGHLVVDPAAPPILRRNYILGTLTDGRWTHLTSAEISAARAEPVVLVGDRPIIYRAPHFMWRVREELVKHFGSLEAVETGGYRVITTLDWKAQQLAEKYITVAAVLPHVSKARATRLAKNLRVSAYDRAWARRLSGRGPRNGAMVAMDYRTGDVLAYVGSAGYYRDDMRSRRFEPKFDVLSQGYRQPGSAFKPIVYATAFDRHVLTPGSLLLDVTTRFARGWAPHDADRRERGPVLVREALQWSLNIPAIRALDRVGSKAVAAQAEKFGISFAGGRKFFVGAGLSAAIGTVEVRPIDLTSAYGVLANNGKLAPPRYVLSVVGPDGQPVFDAGKAKAEEVIDPRAAYQVTEIIAGNTDPKQNPVWAKILRLGNGPRGSRRPAAAKTGTTNETLDYATYGFVAPPKDRAAPGIVAGVWMGNSDHSESRGPGREVISLDGPARVWQAFMRDYTKSMPVARFEPPDGLVRARIDAWTGGRPGSFTRQTTTALFIKGTQPGTKRAVDPPGLMYVRSCGGWRIDLTKAEPERAWRDDVLGWMARARSGSGRFGRYRTATAYLPGRGSWGGQMIGSCAPPPCKVAPDAPGNGNGNGNGNGQSNGCTPPPSPGPTPAPSPPATAPRRRRPIGRRRRGAGPRRPRPCR
ncbi:MAG: transglycosylase domain-containing protein [Candidatus Limnocylindrales bacterium]